VRTLLHGDSSSTGYNTKLARGIGKDVTRITVPLLSFIACYHLFCCDATRCDLGDFNDYCLKGPIQRPKQSNNKDVVKLRVEGDLYAGPWTHINHLLTVILGDPADLSDANPAHEWWAHFAFSMLDSNYGKSVSEVDADEDENDDDDDDDDDEAPIKAPKMASWLEEMAAKDASVRAAMEVRPPSSRARLTTSSLPSSSPGSGS
jgi:hypothetical protein